MTDDYAGIYLETSSDISIIGNSMANNVFGFWFYDSSSNNIVGNNVTDNEDGMALYWSSNNLVYHNNFLHNGYQAFDTNLNVWDNGYPSGGNYWSDYDGTDENRGQYQNETGSDGIGDTPYTVNTNNLDNYPLMSPWINIVGDLDSDGRVSLTDLTLLAQAYDSKPGDANWNELADLAPPWGIISLTDLVTLAMHYGQHYR
jgi:parallel beta-helix repeat protein